MNFNITKQTVGIALLMAVALSGCKETDVTISSVDEATTFEMVAFDAVVTSDLDTSLINEKMSYSWDFGDGTSATGAYPTHVYGQAGTYTVTVTSTDSYTHEIKTSKKEIVISAPQSTLTNQVLVKVIDGKSNDAAALANAEVTINNQTLSTDSNGFALFETVDANHTVLVKATANGYHPQSLQLSANDTTDSRTLNITLTSEAESQEVADISDANSINYTMDNSAYGNITVSFDEDSFVKADGSLASGMTEVSMKPWYPTESTDMSGFLGDALAIDNTGAYTQLISYGAMTVEFTQNGEKLQLAPGKYAKISMPIALDSHYDGRPIQAGDTIPMWYFAENAGTWMLEGNLMGNVVSDDSGQLRLEAEVSHFTTWNWDMKFDNPTSMFIQCQLPNGVATPCNLTARFTYPNSARTTSKQANVGAEGSTVVNIDPSLDSVDFSGVYYDIDTSTLYRGQVSVNPNNGSAIIVLDNAETLNISDYSVIKCKLPSGDIVSCSAGYAVIRYSNMQSDYQTITSTDNRIELTTPASIANQAVASSVELSQVGYYDESNDVYYNTSSSQSYSISEIDNQMIINLENSYDMSNSPNYTNLDINCALPDGSPVDCVVEAIITYDDFSGNIPDTANLPPGAIPLNNSEFKTLSPTDTRLDFNPSKGKVKEVSYSATYVVPSSEYQLLYSENTETVDYSNTDNVIDTQLTFNTWKERGWWWCMEIDGPDFCPDPELY